MSDTNNPQPQTDDPTKARPAFPESPQPEAHESDETATEVDETATPPVSETTAHPSGVPGAQAFASRIDQAKFAMREQGHDEVVRLIDDLYEGVLRLEDKLGSSG